ncbi:yeats-domain-containing protein [Atractiella rhizophila]|nr:yeats-domain-containing protein [Atractiella rhizophila]
MATASRREKGLQIHRPIIYGNTAVLITPDEKHLYALDHTHKWTVAVRSAASPPAQAGEERDPRHEVGGYDDISHFIKRVTFKLHDTYTQPNRHVDKPPFEVTETGWGEFDIQIRIQFTQESGEKPISFMHHLKLHAWNWDALTIKPLPLTPPPSAKALDAPPPAEEQETKQNIEGETKEEEKQKEGADPNLSYPPPVQTPVHSWQYDEIVFTDPTTAFYQTLLANQPTPLPRRARHPWRKTDPPMGAGGNIGELSIETEEEEADRLDEARVKMRIEIERLREKVMAVEKELESHGWGAK